MYLNLIIVIKYKHHILSLLILCVDILRQGERVSCCIDSISLRSIRIQEEVASYNKALW